MLLFDLEEFELVFDLEHLLDEKRLLRLGLLDDGEVAFVFEFEGGDLGDEEVVFRLNRLAVLGLLQQLARETVKLVDLGLPFVELVEGLVTRFCHGLQLEVLFGQLLLELHDPVLDLPDAWHLGHQLWIAHLCPDRRGDCGHRNCH